MSDNKSNTREDLCPDCKGMGYQLQTNQQARQSGRRGVSAPPKCPACDGTGKAKGK